ncbi:winged helix family two component transcriptional regulator [Luteibacter rhizovicinus]|uniref:Winged helix family two component transcriptional regulator n=1 Tax=Luteibacter rhizovicinus TaxID=242606 RepID=A0A4R3YKW1_9GAMM|nr:response regulator transcription factor [Luteibacter rhizovicinus]TCV92890.1 winged helix family two component transcriptional regulator [Luteibacter rhizovicinus]
MNRIALVEDNVRLAGLVRLALSRAGVQVDTFSSIESAWRALASTPYSVLILDRGLPDGDGLSLVRRLRQAERWIPCLMLTARDALHDRIAGLEAGADDYLPKPFSMEELVARVRALLRRPETLKSLSPTFADLKIHPNPGLMICGDESVSLAPAELQIMLCLVEAQGEAVRRTSIEHAAWGLEDAVTPNALDVALHRLRKKLAAIGCEVAITNVRGHGYALRESHMAS